MLVALGTAPQATTGAITYPVRAVRPAQRNELPSLGRLRTLWSKSSFSVNEMDFDTLVAVFTSVDNFEQTRGVPAADQVISDQLQENKVCDHKTIEVSCTVTLIIADCCTEIRVETAGKAGVQISSRSKRTLRMTDVSMHEQFHIVSSQAII